jgi:sulfite exporter TauE/SafE
MLPRDVDLSHLPSKAMPQDPEILLVAAAVGLIHTVMGPDHYLPFAVIGRARGWSLARTATVTAMCGVGHVLGSVALGLIGIAVGITVGSLKVFEASRGSVAAWLLLAFGLVYLVWGVRRALRSRPHSHWHVHEGRGFILHKHASRDGEGAGHTHPETDAAELTPWVLFVIFVFGPCEPLIPLLMYPAAKGSLAAVIAVVVVFGVVTIATMLGLTVAAFLGIGAIASRGGRPVGRYAHVFAGATLCLCGAAMLLGL